MGQKTHPVGFRLGIIKTWNSHWFASGRKFAELAHEDMMVKRYITRRLDNAGVAKIIISRAPKKVTVDIHTSRPGIVIGRKGSEVDKLREELHLLTKKDIMLNIVEVRKPELSAQLVADSIARQLEGRMAFRRAMKKSLAATMKMGAVGIKIQCGGRLGGAEIARSEKYRAGRVPCHTLRADIDYATSTASTTYGCIGVKVWICRGEILDPEIVFKGEEAKTEQATDAPTAARPRRGGRPGDQGGRPRPRGRVRRAGGGGPQGAGQPRGRRPDAPHPKPPENKPRKEARPDAPAKPKAKPEKAKSESKAKPESKAKSDKPGKQD